MEDIDLYMGGLSERSISDGVVGPTFACVIALQFDAARRGDRFFYTTTDPTLSFTSGRTRRCLSLSPSIHLFLSIE